MLFASIVVANTPITKDTDKHNLLTLMGTCYPEKLSINKERIVKELLQGQELATQLQIQLKKPYGGDGFLTSHHRLLFKILVSFSESLSMLAACESDEVCQNLTTSLVNSVCCSDQRTEDSGKSKKRLTTAHGRGSYKRKKISQSWTTVSAVTQDGHAWRKYGQKEILDAKYPRSYFRCIHKYDQGCKATKQVQKMEKDSKMYRTTYIGQHTCMDVLKFPQIVTTDFDTNPWDSNYTLITSKSDSKIPATFDHDQHHHQLKQEYKEETLSDLIQSLSSLEDITWKDFATHGSAALRSNCRAVTTETFQSLDMDFAVKSVNCHTDFQFADSEL